MHTANYALLLTENQTELGPSLYTSQWWLWHPIQAGKLWSYWLFYLPSWW